MNKKQSVSVYIEDKNGNKISIGTVVVKIDILEKSFISDKEKIITIDKLNINVKEGDEIYNNGGHWLNQFKDDRKELDA